MTNISTFLMLSTWRQLLNCIRKNITAWMECMVPWIACILAAWKSCAKGWQALFKSRNKRHGAWSTGYHLRLTRHALFGYAGFLIDLIMCPHHCWSWWLTRPDHHSQNSWRKALGLYHLKLQKIFHTLKSCNQRHPTTIDRAQKFLHSLADV